MQEHSSSKEVSIYDMSAIYQQLIAEQSAQKAYASKQLTEAVPQNFCRSVEESYQFDDQVIGLDELKDGGLVEKVEAKDLLDSSRFKRSELLKRLEEEPDQSMTLYMRTNDVGKSHVLTAEGVVYSTSRPPQNAPGTYVFRPVAAYDRELTREEKRRILQAA